LEKILYPVSENVAKKIDTVLQELRLGTKPANRFIRRASHPVSVTGKAGTSHFMKNVPALPYCIGNSSIARMIQLYSGDWAWAEPTEKSPAANAYLA